MEKRKLSALPRPEATAEMVEMADRLDGMEHIVTAELVDDNKILLLNFYEVSKLKKGKTEAAFRTFLSSDDYITQDLSQSKVKWLTAAFDNMQGFRLWEYKWDQKTWKSEHIPKVFIWTAEDKGIMENFFKAYRKETDENVWNAIDRFQDKVKAERLAEKHRKVLAPIDLRMEPIGVPSQDFTDWVWEQGMSFSRYIDKESERYPIGEKNACMWGYSYNRYKERTDPRIERKQNMAHDWLEYIGWCRELKYDLDNKFIYMPNNFKKVHDRVAGEYKALQDKKAAAEKLRREKLAAKRMEQTKKAMEEIFSKNDGVDAFQIKGKGLILVVPQSGDEIRKEGEALHHCVGGYVERVAKGETNIFFVRKADHPEQSYFTMEWKNNKVVQCRGKSNCGMPPDVKAFVQVFEKKMQDAIQKGDTNGKKKQNLQSA